MKNDMSQDPKKDVTLRTTKTTEKRDQNKDPLSSGTRGYRALSHHAHGTWLCSGSRLANTY